jgi:hypothetical protein
MLEVDALPHWQEMKVAQCCNHGVVLASADSQTSSIVLNCLQPIRQLVRDADERALPIEQEAAYEHMDKRLTCCQRP